MSEWKKSKDGEAGFCKISERIVTLLGARCRRTTGHQTAFETSTATDLWRRGKFRNRRRSVASLMVGSIIDLDLKPICQIKLIDLSY